MTGWGVCTPRTGMGTGGVVGGGKVGGGIAHSCTGLSSSGIQ